MASSYTSLLGLVLPVTGELAGNWGSVWNDSGTSLIDSAIAGTTTLNTDADVTLSTTTGAANQARQAIILWTANGTTTRNITAPAQSKAYVVINKSAGTQSIVFRGVGPTTGVTIAKDEAALVAWNGADFIKISNINGAGQFTDLDVTGTTTLDALTASTALALNASKEIVSVTNTGTGNNVLATSPTLTTPNLGTPSAVTLTNATGLPVSTGISGLGANVATFLATPSSANLAAAVTDETGSGALVFATSPSLTTPTLGVATATSINKVAITAPATGSTLTIADGKTLTANNSLTLAGVDAKTLTVNNSLTLAGTDATTMTFPATSATIARTDAAQTFTGTQTVLAAATQDAVALAGRAGGTGSFVATLTPTTLSASRTVTLPDANTTVPVASQVLTFTGPSAARTITLPDANFTAARTDAAQTFTGTQTFSSNPVINGGAVNGVAYLDGSKVLTTGSALTFDGTNLALGASSVGSTPGYSNFLINGSTGGQILFGAAGSAQQFIFNTSTSLNYYASNASSHIWSVSAAEQMRLTSTGLGIGTSSPAFKLDLSTSYDGRARQWLAATSFVGNNSNGTGFQLRMPSSTTDGIVFSNGGNSAEWARIDAVGNLGLGVTPSAWGSIFKSLDISGGAVSATTGGALVQSGNAVFNGTNWVYKATGSATRVELNAGAAGVAWYTAPSGTAGNAISFTQAMTLTASGNLGLGTTSPDISTYRTFVQDGTVASVLVQRVGGTEELAIYSDSGITQINVASNPLTFATGGTERARITSGGNFKIGGTADRATTEGDKQLVLFDGTAPVGTLANGISIYSSSGEAYVMDAAGNATLFSPHDAETNEWIFRSKHTPTGKVLKIDVERLLKFVNDHFGLDAVHEFIEP